MLININFNYLKIVLKIPLFLNWLFLLEGEKFQFQGVHISQTFHELKKNMQIIGGRVGFVKTIKHYWWTFIV